MSLAAVLVVLAFVRSCHRAMQCVRVVECEKKAECREERRVQRVRVAGRGCDESTREQCSCPRACVCGTAGESKRRLMVVHVVGRPRALSTDHPNRRRLRLGRFERLWPDSCGSGNASFQFCTESHSSEYSTRVCQAL